MVEWWKKKLRGVQMLQLIINLVRLERGVLDCESTESLNLPFWGICKRCPTTMTHPVCICGQAQSFRLPTDSLKRSHHMAGLMDATSSDQGTRCSLKKADLTPNGNTALTVLQVNSYQLLNSETSNDKFVFLHQMTTLQLSLSPSIV